MLTKPAQALEVETDLRWQELTLQVHFVANREHPRPQKKKQGRIRSSGELALEEHLRLKERTGQVNGLKSRIWGFPVAWLEDAGCTAEKRRQDWKLGVDATSSMPGGLEDHHLDVLEIDADERFDGSPA